MLAVIADLTLVCLGYGSDRNLRLGLAGAAISLLFALSRGDRRRIGFVLRPRPSPTYWLRFFALCAVVLTALAGLALCIDWSIDALGSVPKLSPAEFPSRLVWAVGWTPLFEEGSYRVALCSGLHAAGLRTKSIVAISGLTFGGLHLAYGNAAPDNLLAGFLLAWAFLRSGAAWVPIALHALGNAIILTSHRAAWELG
ncbi:MAG: lysostaphin resistance A-like protein [Planctomycetota bacterium]